MKIATASSLSRLLINIQNKIYDWCGFYFTSTTPITTNCTSITHQLAAFGYSIVFGQITVPANKSANITVSLNKPYMSGNVYMCSVLPQTQDQTLWLKGYAYFNFISFSTSAFSILLSNSDTSSAETYNYLVLGKLAS